MNDLMETCKTYLISFFAWLSTVWQSADICLSTATRILVFVALVVRLFGTDIPAAMDRYRKRRAR